MHHIYNTEGIILSSFEVGEANKLFSVFTRELGLVQATAQSVRKINSKNRYGLQDFSISDFSFVRGKNIWRIINASSKKNLFFSLKEESYKKDFLFNIVILLKQFLTGEEKNEILFDIIFNSLNFLEENSFKEDELENFILLTKIRVLHNLGYFNIENKEKFFSDLFKEHKISKEDIKKVSNFKEELEKDLILLFEEIQL